MARFDVAGLPLTRRKVVLLLAAIVFVLFTFSSYRSDFYDSFRNTPPHSSTGQEPIPKIELDDGKFHWANLPQRYPVSSIKPLPSPSSAQIPKIQYGRTTETEEARQVRLSRLEAIKSNFTHAWNGYKTRAWMHDELRPLSGQYQDPFGGWGATLVDTLDTLWMMEMYDDFGEAVKALNQIDFTRCSLDELNVFETTIRYLGGFLAAYDLSKGKYPELLTKAVEIGDMLLYAFDTPNRMPITRWHFQAAMNGAEQVAPTFVLVAEIGSLTLEFTRLSYVTQDPKYYDAVQRIMDIFEQQQERSSVPGMWPIGVNARDENFYSGATFTISGMADSLYEYLPKQHLLLGGGTTQYRRMYTRAVEAMKAHLFYRPLTPSNREILFPGQINFHHGIPLSKTTPEPRAEHLGCFAGGMIGIGGRVFESADDVETAQQLVEGCLWGYETAPLGIMPEIMHTVPCGDQAGMCTWDEATWRAAAAKAHGSERSAETLIAERRLPRGVTHIDDPRYILRPEAIESIFVLYRITADSSLQDRAWNMFEAIVKLTTSDYAHAGLDDCTRDPPRRQDRMESFWTAETLKYFYLLYADPELVSLDEYVFNTEAHPLRRADV